MLAERIKQLRSEHGYSRARAAALLEPYATESSWKAWESGGHPQWKYVLALARFFDVSLDYLAGWTDVRGHAPPSDAASTAPQPHATSATDSVEAAGDLAAAREAARRPARSSRSRRPRA